jgi:hypothetical protein
LYAWTFVGCDTVRSVESEFNSSRAFDRKVQCEAYDSKVEKEFTEAGRELTAGKDKGSYSVERTFYSKKRNSCICVLLYTSVVKKELFYEVQILDVLSKEDLWTKTYSGGAEAAGMNKDIEEQITALE